MRLRVCERNALSWARACTDPTRIVRSVTAALSAAHDRRQKEMPNLRVIAGPHRSLLTTSSRCPWRTEVRGTPVAEVALRPIDDSDVDALIDQMRDPESVRWLPFTAKDPQ